MNGLRLQSPMWLMLLIPLAIVAWNALRRRKRSAVLFSSAALVKNLPVTNAQRMKAILPWFRVAGIALVIVALARPQRGLEEFRIQTEGVAIEMCIDRSGSMQAHDFELDGKRVNRLEVVKKVFRDFVIGADSLAGRPNDLIGLISFGGFAESHCPLTLDHGALVQVLDTVKIAEPIRDSRGRVINESILQEEQLTAIGDALALAVDRLKEVQAKSKIVILLSDGENTAGALTPQDAADVAKNYGIKVYTIGVGTSGRVPFPQKDLFGRTILVSQTVRLDETTLKMLAEKSGGEYFNAQDVGALVDVYGAIDKLERTETKGRLYTRYRELYRFPLYIGFAFVLLELTCSLTRFRSLP